MCGSPLTHLLYTAFQKRISHFGIINTKYIKKIFELECVGLLGFWGMPCPSEDSSSVGYWTFPLALYVEEIVGNIPESFHSLTAFCSLEWKC